MERPRISPYAQHTHISLRFYQKREPGTPMEGARGTPILPDPIPQYIYRYISITRHPTIKTVNKTCWSDSVRVHEHRTVFWDLPNTDQMFCDHRTDVFRTCRTKGPRTSVLRTPNSVLGLIEHQRFWNCQNIANSECRTKGPEQVFCERQTVFWDNPGGEGWIKGRLPSYRGNP